MSSSSTLPKFMGVPEAFNIPLIKSKNVEFVSAPGGTGAMLASLLDDTKSISVCFALTECVVAAIENGAPVRILGPYVASPLTWAICVRNGQKDTDLSTVKWGVSRLGSGSHIMVSVLAEERRWSSPQFVVCNNFTKLRSDLAEGVIDAFLWEKYTTRPYEAAEELSFAGEVVTPWGCFCAVVAYPYRHDLTLSRRALETLLRASASFKQNISESSIKEITDMSGMNEHDAAHWLGALRYAKDGETMNEDDLKVAQQTLLSAKVVDKIRFSNVQDYCIQI